MAQIVVNVTEKGISQTDTKLKKLGTTGSKTEKSISSLEQTTKDFSKNAAAAIATVDGPLGGISSRISSITTVATSGTAAITGLAIGVSALTAATIQGITALDTYETDLVRTEAILKATGNAAGFTAEQLREQADALALATLTSTTEVQKAQAQLLTFNKVQGDVFTDAITLSQDLAETGFGSITSASVQLGKALQDPIRGVGSLAEVGVSFNEAQRETIRLAQESGDVLAAQTIIINALKEQVGGAGSAVAADSLAGKVDTAGQRWTEFTRALAEETGSFDIAKSGADLLTASLEALTKAITGGTTEEQLGVATREFENQQVVVSRLQEELDRLNSVNLKTLGSSQGIAEATRQQKKAAEDLAIAEANLQEKLTSKIALEDDIASKEQARIAAQEQSAKKQAEIAAQDEKDRAEAKAKIQAESDAKDADRLAQQEVREQESIDRKVEALRVGLLSEQELRLENALSQAELISQSTLAEEEQQALLRELWDGYYQDVSDASAKSQQERASNAKMAADEEAKQNKRAIDGWDNLTQDLKSTLGEQNALFKASATVNATIKSYEAANSAYAALAPIPYVGPALGAAAAGVAVAAGLANVAAINSSRAQGGSVNAGDTVLTGERGRELFVPETNGSIISANMLNNAGGGGGGNVYITNNTPSKVEATQDDDGNTYVTIEELDSLVGAALSNPNSDSYQGLSSVASLQRS